MQTLQYWQEKIQEKRKQTPFREFVREVCSWVPRNFYKNCGQISVYPEVQRVGPILSTEDFQQERASLVLPGGEIQGGVFENISSLMLDTPLPGLFQTQAENSGFSDIAVYSKNSYLSFVTVVGVENVLYSQEIADNCRDIMNSLVVFDACESVYNSVGVFRSFNVFYSRFVTSSSNIWFCDNMLGCHDCLLCSGLQNQKYCISNEQYTPEAYAEKRATILKEKVSEYDVMYRTGIKAGGVLASDNAEGNYISSSHDVHGGNFVFNTRHARNCISVGGSGGCEHMYDCFSAGSPSASHFYAVRNSGLGSEHLYCVLGANTSNNLYYCYYMEGCSFCFGCVGLQNTSYCIYNKQYTKEERYEKVDAIFSQMEADGTLGQFFPASMCPFYFNDTAAYLIDPTFTKDEVTKLGYLRRDEPIRVDIPERMETVKTTELDQYESTQDGQRTINPDILKKVIIDEQGNSYRVIKMEYEFLVKHGLPLPRKHWLDRMKENFRVG